MNFHTASYSAEFNKLIYGNICENLDAMVEKAQTAAQQMGFETQIQLKEECETFNKGILKKGMYSVVTKYLSSLKQIDS